MFLLNLLPCLANFSIVAFGHTFLSGLFTLKLCILSKEKMLALLNQTNHLTPPPTLFVILVHASLNLNVLDCSAFCFSRITSLGNDDGKFSSAIYLIGDNMTPTHILDMTHTQKGILYHNAFLRQCFISYLNMHTMHTSQLTIQQHQQPFNWAETIS
jgi:hypothetical protein